VTQEQKAKIREQTQLALKYRDPHAMAILIKIIPELLAALENEEVSSDLWKARAKALERELLKYIPFKCLVCKNRVQQLFGYKAVWGCKQKTGDPCSYEFAEARYVGEGQQ